MSVRLNEEELERWQKARGGTERKELGAWVRAVVEEALQGHPGVPGDVPKMPEVNEAAYLQLVQATSDLRELVTALRERGELPPHIDEVISRLGEAALSTRGLSTPVPGVGTAR
ncbi:hypothetical protein [Streptomyces sp. WMMC940]|uniref:hypothetical protein n=1 Tax=Streptomyces sp. WMMC940 TaxID=3015153 RepID=UPI0022B73206|nr:hypothetical protein [Streptomyces sp. WMMC940]MCZ7458244.1 hypothetical protein [Streptomyces sp. WMMC940]